MRRLILLLCVLLMAFVGGCSKYRVAVSAINQVNEECANSIIYKTIPAPDISSGIIQISLNQFIKANEGYRSWAISINQKAIDLVQDPAMTPAKFGAEITAATLQINKYWGAELVRLVEPVFDAFAATKTPMDQCDREFIKRFCQQRIEHWENMAFLSPTQQFVLENGFKLLSDVLPGHASREAKENIKMSALTAEEKQWLADGRIDLAQMECLLRYGVGSPEKDGRDVIKTCALIASGQSQWDGD